MDSCRISSGPPTLPPSEPLLSGPWSGPTCAIGSTPVDVVRPVSTFDVASSLASLDALDAAESRTARSFLLLRRFSRRKRTTAPRPRPRPKPAPRGGTGFARRREVQQDKRRRPCPPPSWHLCSSWPPSDGAAEGAAEGAALPREREVIPNVPRVTPQLAKLTHHSTPPPTNHTFARPQRRTRRRGLRVPHREHASGPPPRRLLPPSGRRLGLPQDGER